MAQIVGGVGTSHVPVIGAVIDRGQDSEDAWQPLFAGYAELRRWVASLDVDVAIVVYNDHAAALSLEVIPTFALGVAPAFPPADEGFGARPVPVVEGEPELAWHLAESLILDEFDLTIMNELAVDHGLTVPLSILFGRVDAWPVRVVPICVNVVQFPPPTARRCYRLGQAIARAVSAFDGDLRVAVVGTGGMSHQLQGERAGHVNPAFDARFLDDLTADPARLAGLSHTELMRDAGTEGVELVMWLVMRGALGDGAVEVHRHYHVPVSNTAAGLVALEPAQALERTAS